MKKKLIVLAMALSILVVMAVPSFAQAKVSVNNFKALGFVCYHESFGTSYSGIATLTVQFEGLADPTDYIWLVTLGNNNFQLSWRASSPLSGNPIDCYHNFPGTPAIDVTINYDLKSSIVYAYGRSALDPSLWITYIGVITKVS